MSTRNFQALWVKNNLDTKILSEYKQILETSSDPRVREVAERLLSSFRFYMSTSIPAMAAGFSSSSCCGCNRVSVPYKDEVFIDPETKEDYNPGYFLLSSRGVNHPFHFSCAQEALREWEDWQKLTGQGRMRGGDCPHLHRTMGSISEHCERFHCLDCKQAVYQDFTRCQQCGNGKIYLEERVLSMPEGKTLDSEGNFIDLD